MSLSVLFLPNKLGDWSNSLTPLGLGFVNLFISLGLISLILSPVMIAPRVRRAFKKVRNYLIKV